MLRHGLREFIGDQHMSERKFLLRDQRWTRGEVAHQVPAQSRFDHPIMRAEEQVCRDAMLRDPAGHSD